MKSREWCVCNCNLKKMFMGFHLKIKIIHRHIWVEKRKFCRLKISWACITGQIVFVLESFGSKATRSERLLLILHMALQLDLYQNFVHTFNPASRRVVQYSQIDSIGVSGDKKGLHWYQWYDWYQWKSTLFQWFYWWICISLRGLRLFSHVV